MCVCFWQDSSGGEEGKRLGRMWSKYYLRVELKEGGTSSLLVQSSQSFPSSVTVSGFKRGASWTPTESLLLRIVIKVRQNQNIAFFFGSGGCGVTWGSLLFQWHDVLHQACNGGVDVGVILERERRDKVWEMDGGCRGGWSCYLHADLKHYYCIYVHLHLKACIWGKKATAWRPHANPICKEVNQGGHESRDERWRLWIPLIVHQRAEHLTGSSIE